MILAIDATLIKYAADGPLWNQDGIEGKVCQKSWWTNLLYVNNFVYLDDQVRFARCKVDMCMWTYVYAVAHKIHICYKHAAHVRYICTLVIT